MYENFLTHIMILSRSPRFLDTDQIPPPEPSVFCLQDGGMSGVTDGGQSNHKTYFVGVIDILQQYNSRKIAETFFKGLRHNRKQISAVHPTFYGDRFLDFMDTYVLIDEKEG